MDANNFLKLLQCVGKATASALPEIVEPLPVYGKSLSAALKAVRQGIEDYKNKKISAEKLNQIKSTFDDAVKEEALQIKPPTYMDCVIFHCKSGCTLSDDQQTLLANVFEKEIDDEKIGSFMSNFMTDEPCQGDDYFIGDDYISLNFSEYDEYPYDKDILSQLQQGLNVFLGVDLFDYFVAFGHDESHDEW